MARGSDHLAAALIGIVGKARCCRVVSLKKGEISETSDRIQAD